MGSSLKAMLPIAAVAAPFAMGMFPSLGMGGLLGGASAGAGAGAGGLLGSGFSLANNALNPQPMNVPSGGGLSGLLGNIDPGMIQGLLGAQGGEQQPQNMAPPPMPMPTQPVNTAPGSIAEAGAGMQAGPPSGFSAGGSFSGMDPAQAIPYPPMGLFGGPPPRAY